MPSEITLAINELIRNGNRPATVMPGFELVDIYPIVKHLFNQKAIATLENKTHSLLHQYNEFIGPNGFECFDKVLRLMFKLKMKVNFDWTKLYDRKLDQVFFFGSTCTKKTLPLAIEKVIKSVNDVADKDFTKACMVPLGIIKFAVTPGEEEKMAVLSYVTLTPTGEVYVKTNMPNMLCKEGEIPTAVENQ